MTLKKILTQETKPVATLDRKLRRQEEKIAQYQAYLDKLKDTYEKDCEKSVRLHSLKDKLGATLAALKPKPKPKKARKAKKEKEKEIWVYPSTRRLGR